MHSRKIQLLTAAAGPDNVIFWNQIKINEENLRSQGKNPVSKRI